MRDSRLFHPKVQDHFKRRTKAGRNDTKRIRYSDRRSEKATGMRIRSKTRKDAGLFKRRSDVVIEDVRKDRIHRDRETEIIVEHFEAAGAAMLRASGLLNMRQDTKGQKITPFILNVESTKATAKTK